MRPRRLVKRWIWAISALILLITAFASFASFAAVASFPGGSLELSVVPAGGGEPLLVVPVRPGERFVLHYIHSVDGTPVWETHGIGRDGTIYIEEERFVILGAGMGHWEGHGSLTSRDGQQVIENIHEPVGDFVLRIGSESVGHTIIWRGKRFELSRHAAGRAVTISTARVGLLRRIRHRLIYCDDGTAPTET